MLIDNYFLDRTTAQRQAVGWSRCIARGLVWSRVIFADTEVACNVYGPTSPTQ